MMRKKTHYGKRPCRMCGRSVTNNALGRAAHERACHGKQQSNRYLLVEDVDGVERETPICNSEAIAFGCFETACKSAGAFAVQLIDTRSGRIIKSWQYEGPVGLQHP
jgi:hypothetical protein